MMNYTALRYVTFGRFHRRQNIALQFRYQARWLGLASDHSVAAVSLCICWHGGWPASRRPTSAAEDRTAALIISSVDEQPTSTRIRQETIAKSHQTQRTRHTLHCS